MLKIGLTGGIASGKSTVSKILKDLGATVVDVDLIARDVVVKGSRCLEQIVRYFGEEVLLEDGSLNRKKLRDIVFSDRDKLKVLNGITHPEIIARVIKQLEFLEREKRLDRAVVDAAILIEMGLHRHVDVVWLVRVDREVQIKRLMKRDNISRNEAEAIISTQMPVEKKEQYAHVIIDNSGTLEELEARVRKLWESTSNGSIYFG